MIPEHILVICWINTDPGELIRKVMESYRLAANQAKWNFCGTPLLELV